MDTIEEEQDKQEGRNNVKTEEITKDEEKKSEIVKEIIEEVTETTYIYKGIVTSKEQKEKTENEEEKLDENREKNDTINENLSEEDIRAAQIDQIRKIINQEIFDDKLDEKIILDAEESTEDSKIKMEIGIITKEINENVSLIKKYAIEHKTTENIHTEPGLEKTKEQTSHDDEIEEMRKIINQEIMKGVEDGKMINVSYEIIEIAVGNSGTTAKVFKDSVYENERVIQKLAEKLVRSRSYKDDIEIMKSIINQGDINKRIEIGKILIDFDSIKGKKAEHKISIDNKELKGIKEGCDETAIEDALTNEHENKENTETDKIEEIRNIINQGVGQDKGKGKILLNLEELSEERNKIISQKEQEEEEVEKQEQLTDPASEIVGEIETLSENDQYNNKNEIQLKLELKPDDKRIGAFDDETVMSDKNVNDDEENNDDNKDKLVKVDKNNSEGNKISDKIKEILESVNVIEDETLMKEDEDEKKECKNSVDEKKERSDQADEKKERSDQVDEKKECSNKADEKKECNNQVDEKKECSEVGEKKECSEVGEKKECSEVGEKKECSEVDEKNECKNDVDEKKERSDQVDEKKECSNQVVEKKECSNQVDEKKECSKADESSAELYDNINCSETNQIYDKQECTKIDQVDDEIEYSKTNQIDHKEYDKSDQIEDKIGYSKNDQANDEITKNKIEEMKHIINQGIIFEENIIKFDDRKHTTDKEKENDDNDVIQGSLDVNNTSVANRDCKIETISRDDNTIVNENNVNTFAYVDVNDEHKSRGNDKCELKSDNVELGINEKELKQEIEGTFQPVNILDTGGDDIFKILMDAEKLDKDAKIISDRELETVDLKAEDTESESENAELKTHDDSAFQLFPDNRENIWKGLSDTEISETVDKKSDDIEIGNIELKAEDTDLMQEASTFMPVNILDTNGDDIFKVLQDAEMNKNLLTSKNDINESDLSLSDTDNAIITPDDEKDRDLYNPENKIYEYKHVKDDNNIFECDDESRNYQLLKTSSSNEPHSDNNDIFNSTDENCSKSNLNVIVSLATVHAESPTAEISSDLDTKSKNENTKLFDCNLPEIDVDLQKIQTNAWENELKSNITDELQTNEVKENIISTESFIEIQPLVGEIINKKSESEPDLIQMQPITQETGELKFMSIGYEGEDILHILTAGRESIFTPTADKTSVSYSEKSEVPIPPVRKKRSPSVPVLNTFSSTFGEDKLTLSSSELEIMPPPRKKFIERKKRLLLQHNQCQSPLKMASACKSYSLSDISVYDSDDIDFFDEIGNKNKLKTSVDDPVLTSNTNSIIKSFDDSVLNSKPYGTSDDSVLNLRSFDANQENRSPNGDGLRASVMLLDAEFSSNSSFNRPKKTQKVKKKSHTFTKGDIYLNELRDSVRLKKKSKSFGSLIRRTLSLKEIRKSHSDNPPCLPNLFKKYRQRKKHSQCNLKTMPTIREESDFRRTLTSESFKSIFVVQQGTEEEEDDVSYVNRCIGYGRNMSLVSLSFPDMPEAFKRKSSSSIDASLSTSVSSIKTSDSQQTFESKAALPKAPLHRRLREIMQGHSTSSLNKQSLQRAKELLDKSLGDRSKEESSLTSIPEPPSKHIQGLRKGSISSHILREIGHRFSSPSFDVSKLKQAKNLVHKSFDSDTKAPSIPQKTNENLFGYIPKEMSDSGSIHLNDAQPLYTEKKFNKTFEDVPEEQLTDAPVPPKRSKSKLSINSESIEDFAPSEEVPQEVPALKPKNVMLLKMHESRGSTESFKSIFASSREAKDVDNRPKDTPSSVFDVQDKPDIVEKKKLDEGSSETLNIVTHELESDRKKRLDYLKEHAKNLDNIGHRIHHIQDSQGEYHEKVMRSFIRRYSHDIEALTESGKLEELTSMYQVNLEQNEEKMDQVASKEILGVDKIDDISMKKLNWLNTLKRRESELMIALPTLKEQLSDEKIDFNTDKQRKNSEDDEDSDDKKWEVYKLPCKTTPDFVNKETLIKECLDGTFRLKLVNFVKSFKPKVDTKLQENLPEEDNNECFDDDYTPKLGNHYDNEILHPSDLSKQDVENMRKFARKYESDLMTFFEVKGKNFMKLADSEIAQRRSSVFPFRSWSDSWSDSDSPDYMIENEPKLSSAFEETTSLFKRENSVSTSKYLSNGHIERDVKCVPSTGVINNITNSPGLKLKKTVSISIAEPEILVSKKDSSSSFDEDESDDDDNNDANKNNNNDSDDTMNENLKNQIEFDNNLHAPTYQSFKDHEINHYENSLEPINVKQNNVQNDTKNDFLKNLSAKVTNDISVYKLKKDSVDCSECTQPQKQNFSNVDQLAKEYETEILSQVENNIPHLENRLKTISKYSYLNMKINEHGLIENSQRLQFPKSRKKYSEDFPRTIKTKYPFVKRFSLDSSKMHLNGIKSSTSHIPDWFRFQPLSLTKLAANVYFSDRKLEMFSKMMDTSEAINKFLLSLQGDKSGNVQFISLDIPNLETPDLPVEQSRAEPSIEHLYMAKQDLELTHESKPDSLMPDDVQPESDKKFHEAMCMAPSPKMTIENTFHFPYVMTDDVTPSDEVDTSLYQREKNGSPDNLYNRLSDYEKNIEKARNKIVPNPLTDRKFIICPVSTESSFFISDIPEETEEHVNQELSNSHCQLDDLNISLQKDSGFKSIRGLDVENNFILRLSPILEPSIQESDAFNGDLDSNDNLDNDILSSLHPILETPDRELDATDELDEGNGKSYKNTDIDNDILSFLNPPLQSLDTELGEIDEANDKPNSGTSIDNNFLSSLNPLLASSNPELSEADDKSNSKISNNIEFEHFISTSIEPVLDGQSSTTIEPDIIFNEFSDSSESVSSNEDAPTVHHISDLTNTIKAKCLFNCECHLHSDEPDPVRILAVYEKPESPEYVLRTWYQRQEDPEACKTPSPVSIPKWVGKESTYEFKYVKDTPSPGPPPEGTTKSSSSSSSTEEGENSSRKEEDRTQKDRCVEVYPETIRQRQRNMAPSPSKVDIKNWEPSNESSEDDKKFLPSVKALRNQFENGKTKSSSTTNNNNLVRTPSDSSTNSLVMNSLDTSSGFGSLTSSQVTLEQSSTGPTVSIKEHEEESVEPIFSQFREVDDELKEMMSKPPSTHGWNPYALLKRLYFVPDAPKIHRREAPFVNIEGYLEKLPSGRKKATFWNAWKRRYFVAKDGILYYYQNNQTEKPNMKLPLMGGKIEIMDPNMISVEDGGREPRNACMLGIDDGKGHYVVVRCPSRQEAERWKHALETHTVDDFFSHYVQPWPRPTNPTLLRDTLVIDIGSCSVRAGVLTSQPTLPQIFFPSVVATNRETKSQIWGIDALMPDVRTTSVITFPVRPSHKISKFSVDLNAVSSLLQKTFNDLKVDPKNYNIQLSVPRVLNPHTQAELLKILFDKYGVKSVNMTHQSILALYAYNATSGIVVDIGERLDVVPVIDGYIVDGGVSRVPYGGYRILDHLRQFLFQKNISLLNEIDSFIIRQILENICYCAQHYNTEKQRCTMNSEKFEKTASLADFFPEESQFEAFRDLSLDFGRFQATEGLFNPDAWGLDHPGLHKLVHKAIQECSMDIRKELSRSIFLCGGVTQLPGIADRLTVELDNLTPPAIRPKVHASPYRYHASYLGACILAESEAFAHSKITKEEWTKQGNSALRKWAL